MLNKRKNKGELFIVTLIVYLAAMSGHVTESLHYLRCCVQRVKKVVSDSPGLVDFAIWLVNSVFNLPNGQVMFLEESE